MARNKRPDGGRPYVSEDVELVLKAASEHPQYRCDENNSPDNKEGDQRDWSGAGNPSASIAG